MSLKLFKKKLEKLEGSYDLNFAKEDDCHYLFELYGGETNMKEKYPQTYRAFLKAKECTLKADNYESKDNCKGEIGKLAMVDYESNSSAGFLKASGFSKLKFPISGIFVDDTKTVSAAEEAQPWTGIIAQVKLKKKNDPGYIIKKSLNIFDTNHYEGYAQSPVDEKSEFNNNNYDMQVTLIGRNPSGALFTKVVKKSQLIGEEQEVSAIKNVIIEDPTPKNSKHSASEEIMMLYGRTNQQEIYNDADYKGGDYLNNIFSDNKVHLLLPIKGKMYTNKGFKPIDLSKPASDEVLLRFSATYDYKEQVFYYRGDIKDDNTLYAQLKNCFSQEGYNPGMETTVSFDIKNPNSEDGRSVLDWHSDVQGVQDGQPKTIMLDGGFTYSIENAAMGQQSDEQVTIKSMTKERKNDTGLEYYKYYQEFNTIYIPPITIYWGCFARDVEITMADGTTKPASEIKAGELIRGYDEKSLRIEDIVTGQDKYIYSIETREHGNIKVSGGHPMMCEGKMKRANAITLGDKLNLADGSLAEVKSVEVVEYDDTVYNFTFEGEENGVYLIANGFYSGDLKMQNIKEKKIKRTFTLEEKQMMEEAKLYVEAWNADEEIGEII